MELEAFFPSISVTCHTSINKYSKYLKMSVMRNELRQFMAWTQTFSKIDHILEDLEEREEIGGESEIFVVERGLPPLPLNRLYQILEYEELSNKMIALARATQPLTIEEEPSAILPETPLPDESVLIIPETDIDLTPEQQSAVQEYSNPLARRETLLKMSPTERQRQLAEELALTAVLTPAVEPRTPSKRHRRKPAVIQSPTIKTQKEPPAPSFDESFAQFEIDERLDWNQTRNEMFLKFINHTTMEMYDKTFNNQISFIYRQRATSSSEQPLLSLVTHLATANVKLSKQQQKIEYQPEKQRYLAELFHHLNAVPSDILENCRSVLSLLNRKYLDVQIMTDFTSLAHFLRTDQIAQLMLNICRLVKLIYENGMISISFEDVLSRSGNVGMAQFIYQIARLSFALNQYPNNEAVDFLLDTMRSIEYELLQMIANIDNPEQQFEQIAASPRARMYLMVGYFFFNNAVLIITSMLQNIGLMNEWRGNTDAPTASLSDQLSSYNHRFIEIFGDTTILVKTDLGLESLEAAAPITQKDIGQYVLSFDEFFRVLRLNSLNKSVDLNRRKILSKQLPAVTTKLMQQQHALQLAYLNKPPKPVEELIVQRTAQDVLAIRFPFRYKKRFDWEISNYATGTSRPFDLSATLLFLFGTSNIHAKQVALEDRIVKMYYSPYQTAIQTDQMIEQVTTNLFKTDVAANTRAIMRTDILHANFKFEDSVISVYMFDAYVYGKTQAVNVAAVLSAEPRLIVNIHRLYIEIERWSMEYEAFIPDLFESCANLHAMDIARIISTYFDISGPSVSSNLELIGDFVEVTRQAFEQMRSIGASVTDEQKFHVLHFFNRWYSFFMMAVQLTNTLITTGQ